MAAQVKDNKERKQSMKQIKIFSGISGEPMTDPEERANKWIQQNENDTMKVLDIHEDFTACGETLYILITIIYEIPDDTYRVRPDLAEKVDQEHEDLVRDVLAQESREVSR